MHSNECEQGQVGGEKWKVGGEKLKWWKINHYIHISHLLNSRNYEQRHYTTFILQHWLCTKSNSFITVPVEKYECGDKENTLSSAGVIF